MLCGGDGIIMDGITGTVVDAIIIVGSG